MSTGPKPNGPRSQSDERADDYLEQLEEQEPLSLAEEIAGDRDRGVKDGTNDHYEKIKQGEIHIAELQKLSMAELIESARKENVTEVAGMKKQDLIFRILKERVKMNGLMYGEGTLEILPDGFGFLRSPDYHYLSCPDDIYVSPSQMKAFWAAHRFHRFWTNPSAQRKRTLLCSAASRGDQLSRPQLDVGLRPVR